MAAVQEKQVPTILVADDESAGREILCRRLSASGYRTLQAVDGEQALSMALEHHPDLLLLDVVMPKRDGFEVARRIKSNQALSFTPVILVTAKVGSEDIVAGLEAGADEYLTKPIDPHALVARVRSMLRIKDLHDQVRKQAAELEDWNEILKSVQTGLGDILSRAQIAVFALDGQRHVHFRNACANRLLGELFVVRDNKLNIQSADDREEFERAVGRATAHSGEASPPLSLVTTSLDSFAVYVLPLQLANKAPRVGVFAGASLLVLGIGYTVRTPANPAVLERLFSLTPSEARLASLVGTGMSPREAAEILSITEETARTVLKRVFSKANVSRQPELVGLLSRIAID
jgi:DNA-binding response OmpR family regulator/DNA-binding CsgD family transcriptional regulator